MRFTKMQGAGNDFVLLETDDRQRDWPQLAVAMCDRHYGIGADGVLVMLPSDVADFQMRVFNADGSEANACGNGLRCMVKHFLDGQLANPGTRRVSVETVAGVRRAEVGKAGKYPFCVLKFMVKHVLKILMDLKCLVIWNADRWLFLRVLKG